MKKTLFLLLSLFALMGPLTAQAMDEPVQASLIHEVESIQPGHSFFVITKLKLDDGWHAYWKNPGDAGMAPSIEWKLPEGFEAKETKWPTPKRFTVDESVGYGYEGEVLLLTEIVAPKTIKEGQNPLIEADLSWVVCSDTTCLPGGAEISLSLPVSAEAPKESVSNGSHFATVRKQIPSKNGAIKASQTGDVIQIEIPHKDKKIQGQFFPEEANAVKDHAMVAMTKNGNDQHALELAAEGQKENLKGVLVLNTDQGEEAYEVDMPLMSATPVEFEGGIGLAIILAFVGGIILNMMPCVLPVLSFKVLSFVKMAGESRSKTLLHGIMFTLGVLVSFWAIAGTLLALQAYGSAVGWGFQLQEPIFVAILAAVLLIFSINLFGVFEMGTSIASKAGQASTGNEGMMGSFFSGILATAVATPCTGPFLGSAIGFAVTQPAILSMLIFTSLALGMASPYLILAAFPRLLKFMPKPGAWMETFKQMMGFLMLASVIWLVWVFGAQVGSLGMSILLISFFLMSIACWVYGSFGTPIKSRTTRMVSYAVASIFFSLGGFALYTSAAPWVEETQGTAQSTGDWEKFDPMRIAELQRQGIPVFVDFTAKWCLICQTNHVALSTKGMTEEFNKRGVVKMKADWTKRDPVITAELKKFGRSGVPLYVLYSPDPKKAPEVLPQVLTPDVVMDYLEKENAHIASYD
jgi:thiol:disulfide interchange protein DsbD